MTAATRTTLFLILALGGAGCFAKPAPDLAAARPPTVVFLVRHAEPVYPPPADAPRDPPLNRPGRERAARLAEVLQDAGIERILSSDYRRTRETAAPLAARLGLAVELYDPRELRALAARLAAAPGRVLVTGHSNTTPELVALLGGDPGEPIDEKTEFDRLYAVVLTAGRRPVTTLLHYGEPPRAWPPEDPAARREREPHPPGHPPAWTRRPNLSRGSQ